MPINIRQLKDLSRDKGFHATTETVKVARTQLLHIEINFSSPQNIWIGFSICTDDREKHEKAKNIQEKCEDILRTFDENLLHHGNEAVYKHKGTPGQLSSYIFFCIKCPFIATKALDRLEQLESYRAELESMLEVISH
jgi:hypothetical protein|tara:strand:+ start:114 stop:527 length:414 start_codon:yes stop_codon:yes gene_type:complete